MAQQFYVSPEQMMKDRADFARKGIARGRSVVVTSCREGIALVAENPSPSLHKIGEIYDRIAFAAVGKYNEFESLRQAGVRYADVRGYSYAREDVTARGLASVYSQSLGAVFIAESKPFEVELAVAEVGAVPAEDRLYRLNFDGAIADEQGFVAMGGQSERVQEALGRRWNQDAGFAAAVADAVAALTFEPAGDEAPEQARPGQNVPGQNVPGQNVPGIRERAATIEVAVLDRDPLSSRGTHRAFRRLREAEIADMLAQGAGN